MALPIYHQNETLAKTHAKTRMKLSTQTLKSEQSNKGYDENRPPCFQRVR